MPDSTLSRVLMIRWRKPKATVMEQDQSRHIVLALFHDHQQDHPSDRSGPFLTPGPLELHRMSRVHNEPLTRPCPSPSEAARSRP